MGKVSAISWTDATFNPWWGCTKVGPACDLCYSETFDKRVGGDHWGHGKPRRQMSDAYWREPIKWNQLSLQTYGRRMRVFCASMADVFDNEVPPEWRERLWKLIAETPNLEWILVTKRIGNVPKMVPFDWMAHGFPEFVTLCITVANQNEAERDIYKLLGIPVAVRGLSIEPLLGSINLTRLDLTSHGLDYLDCLRGLRFNFHPSIQQAEGEPFVPSGAKIAWVKVVGRAAAQSQGRRTQATSAICGTSAARPAQLSTSSSGETGCQATMPSRPASFQSSNATPGASRSPPWRAWERNGPATSSTAANGWRCRGERLTRRRT
jgi:protein gp37